MKRFAIIAGVVALASVASAQVVVPNAFASVSSNGTGLNTFIRDSGNPRSGQLLISSSQLSTISVGSQITGLSFRLYNGNTTGFPATAATWSDYTINMGVGVALGTQTTTFATNFASGPTTVRSGALTINPGAFSGGATGTTPNPFGTTISFTTPYTYTGGNLLIEIRHTGSNIVNGTTDFLDALPQTTTGYGTDYWAMTATGNTAATGAQANFTITRLEVQAVPEPATMAVLGIGALAMLRRRKKA